MMAVFLFCILEHLYSFCEVFTMLKLTQEGIVPRCLEYVVFFFPSKRRKHHTLWNFRKLM